MWPIYITFTLNTERTNKPPPPREVERAFSLGFHSSERTVSPFTDRRREERARAGRLPGQKVRTGQGEEAGPAWASTLSADPPPSAESCSPVSAARSRPQCHPGPAETAEAREKVRREYSGAKRGPPGAELRPLQPGCNKSAANSLN